MTDIFKGATSNSVFIELVDSSTGLPKTGIVYTDVTGSYARTRSARVAITMATLASASAAFSSGGFILVDDTNQPGVYRVDVPDAAFVTGVQSVVLTIKATGCRTVSRLFNLVDVNNQVAYAPNVAAGGVGGLLTAPTTANTGLSNVTQFGGTNLTAASGIPEVKVASIAADALNAAAISADAGAELAALVEAYIVNEGDATAVMQAIADRIAADWVAGDASPLAVAAAVWANATRTITGGSLTTAPPTAQQVWEYATRTITGGSLTTSPPTAAVIADAVWDEARADHVTAGTFGEKVNAELDSVSRAAILTQQLIESYAADGAAPTVAQALMMLLQHHQQKSVSGTTVTIKQLDKSTTAGTYTLDDADDPTSITRAT